MAEYFQKIDNDNGRYLLRKKVQIDEVENLEESLTSISNAGKTPFFQVLSPILGTDIITSGIYDISYGQTDYQAGISYTQDPLKTAFSHVVTGDGYYKMTVNLMIQVESFSAFFDFGTKVRTVATRNDANSGIISQTMHGVNDASVTRPTLQDDAETERYRDMTEGGIVYEKMSFDNGTALIQAVTGDKIGCRLYVYKGLLDVFGETLSNPIRYKARILVEKIW